MDWGHRNSMRFSPMWLSISGKVVSNLRLAGGSLWALQLPSPPITNIPYPTLLPLHSSLPIQTDSQHACQTQQNQSEADHAYSVLCGNSDNWENGLTRDQKLSGTLTTTKTTVPPTAPKATGLR